MKCPVCAKTVRVDNLSRHVGTHIVEIISKLSEEQKANQIQTKNVVLSYRVKNPAPDCCIPLEDFAYCTVCKHIKNRGVLGHDVGKFRTDHPKGDCGKQWDKVSHLFTGGKIVYVVPKAKETTAELLEIKEQLEQAEESQKEIQEMFDTAKEERNKWRDYHTSLMDTIDEQWRQIGLLPLAEQNRLYDLLQPIKDKIYQGIEEPDED